MTESDILSTYQTKLTEDWTYKAFCGREYILVEELKRWMNTREEHSAQQNVTLLLDKVHGGHFNAPDSQAIREGLIVFAILLSINRGHLILPFLQCGISDDNLITSHLGERQPKLSHTELREDPEVVICLVEEKKWAFCPMNLSLNMTYRSYSAETVLPFCKWVPINAKGGTAKLWQILAKEEVIMPDLRERLRRSLIDDPQHGKCYRLAIKSYEGPSNQNYFDWEREALEVLRGQEGMIQCFGTYDIPDRFGNDPSRGNVRTRNLILEYGELDLDEFFFEEQPLLIMPEQLHSFWKALFKIALGLSKIHNRHYQKTDRTFKLQGWHADIKPDNILCVNGEFKLVDFGFAKFKNFREDELPLEYMDVGTQTYGAPECDTGRLRRGTRTHVAQTIDIWSFGCVLSQAATWVVAGKSGLILHSWLRQEAIEKLAEIQKSDSTVSVPQARDAFHDGRDVLPEVQKWHNYLRNGIRSFDNITHHILDLVERHLLCQNPLERFTSTQLCNALEGITNTASESLHREQPIRPYHNIDPVIVELIDAVRESSHTSLEPRPSSSSVASEARSFVVDLGRVMETPAQAGDVAYRKSIRIKKQKRLEKPIMQAIHETTSGSGSEHQGLDRTFSFRQSRPLSTRRLPFPENLHGRAELGSGSVLPNISESTTFPQSNISGTFNQEPRSSNETRYNWKHHNHQAEFNDNRVERPWSPSHLSYQPPVIYHDQVSSQPPIIYHNQVTSPPQLVSPIETMAPPDLGLTHSPIDMYTPPRFFTESSTFSNDESEAPIPVDTPNESTGIGLPPPESASTVQTRIFVEAGLQISDVRNIYSTLDICRVRAELDKGQPGLLKGIIKGKSKDKIMGQFIKNRDIVLVVDNASTMAQWWDYVQFTAETLALKVNGTDEDGIDLMFTRGDQHNNIGGRGKSLLGAFKKYFDKNRPDSDGGINTNMTQVLSERFDHFQKKYRQKSMTLLVLTDGLWKGNVDPKSMEERIKKFASLLKNAGRTEERRFSIEFISFGNDDEAHARLADLDDNLKTKYGIEDIIDTEHWTGAVDKMILGSFNEDHDAQTTQVTAPEPSQLTPDDRTLTTSSNRTSAGRRLLSRIPGSLRRS